MQENLLIQKVRNEKPDEEHRDTDNESFYRVYHRERHFSVCPEIFNKREKFSSVQYSLPVLLRSWKAIKKASIFTYT